MHPGSLNKFSITVGSINFAFYYNVKNKNKTKKKQLIDYPFCFDNIFRARKKNISLIVKQCRTASGRPQIKLVWYKPSRPMPLVNRASFIFAMLSRKSSHRAFRFLHPGDGQKWSLTGLSSSFNPSQLRLAALRKWFIQESFSFWVNAPLVNNILIMMQNVWAQDERNKNQTLLKLYYLLHISVGAYSNTRPCQRRNIEHTELLPLLQDDPY